MRYYKEGQPTHNRDSREERAKGVENIFEEIMAENFPNLKETDTKREEAQRVPNKLNTDSHKTYYNKNGKS